MGCRKHPICKQSGSHTKQVNTDMKLLENLIYQPDFSGEVPDDDPSVKSPFLGQTGIKHRKAMRHFRASQMFHRKMAEPWGTNTAMWPTPPQRHPTMPVELYKKLHEQMEREFKAGDKFRQSLLHGQKVVFTGFRDDWLSQMVKDCGGEMQSAASGKTTIVVADDPNSKSGKIQKAKEIGAFIISKAKFRQILTLR